MGSNSGNQNLSMYIGAGEKRLQRIEALGQIASALGVKRSVLLQKIADGDFIVGEVGTLAPVEASAWEQVLGPNYEDILAGLTETAQRLDVDLLVLLEQVSSGEFVLIPRRLVPQSGD